MRHLISSNDTLNILAVEDEIHLLNFLVNILKMFKHDVVAVTTGKSALAALSETQFDLIMTDGNLDDIDGYALAEKARSIQPDIFTMVISGDQPESAKELDSREIDVFLGKPFSIEDIKYHTNKFLRYKINKFGGSQEAENEAENDRFFAEVAHQLKSPAAVVKEFVHLFRHTFSEGLTDKQSLYLDAIDENINRLLSLVNNIDNMNRLKSNGWVFDIEEENPVEIIESVKLTWEPLLNLRNMRLDVSVPDHVPSIDVDRLCVEQILFNLLDNAGKYGPEGSTVRIELICPDDGSVTIYLVDEGPGITDPDRELIFTPYGRLPEHSASPGLGLGLAVAQQLARGMNGELWVESSDSGGAKFCLSLAVSK